MKSFQFHFNDAIGFEQDLISMKNECAKLRTDNVLFYLSWAEPEHLDLKDIIGIIEKIFPDALYYGNEASGNIQNGDLSFGVSVTCHVFEDKGTETRLLWVQEGTEYSSLQDLWNFCRTQKNLKAVELIPTMTYLYRLNIDNNIPELDSDIQIFGGSSINFYNPTLESNIIAKGHDESKNGMAVILYYGANLNVSSTYVIGWKGLGRYMKVTESHDMIINTIDGQPARCIYEKYLNLQDEDNDNLVFPLIVEEDGIEFIRTPRGFLPDKSMSMIVDVAQGALTRIAYGDKNTILESLFEKAEEIEKFGPQTIKVYSCTARKLYWGDDEVSKETHPLQALAPVSGFYTGGEILRFGKKIRVLNSTLVLVSMREGDFIPSENAITFEKHDKSQISRITHFVGIIAKEQEEAMRIVEEEKQRNDILHDIIHSLKWSFFVNAQDEITHVEITDKFWSMTGLDLNADGYEWIKAVHPDDRGRALSAFNATIRDHSCNTPYDTTYRMIDKFGKYHWFRSAGRMVRYEDGTGEFYGVHTDITDQIERQVQNQRRLEEALAMAQSSNKAKTAFLNNMSHDIRTPMNAIKGFTSMAKMFCYDKEKVLGYLDKIEISSQQLLLLINQVLEMSRIESGKIEIVEKAVNIKDRFNAIVTILAEQANENGLTFNHSLEILDHCYVMADEARMSQITMNIAGNAMKYTPKGGNIDFSLKEVPSDKDGYARFVFTVSDTGIGMSQDFQKTLFDPFTREKSTTVSKIQGTGLGMTIVKNLVDLLGGTIIVHSEPGKGTRFDVTVDFKIATNNELSTELNHEDRTEMLKGKRVLLVEDNEMNREIARFILEDLGLEIEEADDGDVAVDLLTEIADKGEYDRFDFVLMDIQMPRMNGLEATAHIRAIPVPDGLHMPIIAMTANVFEEDRNAALAAGMDDHIGKPIDRKQLVEVLSKYI